MVRWLADKYKLIHFLADEDGFEATGPPELLAAMESDLFLLDQVGFQKEVEIKHGDLNEAKSLLGTLVPDVFIEVSGPSCLMIVGTPGAVEQALELIDQLDKPLDPVEVEFQLALDTPELRSRLSGNSEEGPRVMRWTGENQDEIRQVYGLGLLLAPRALPAHLLLARQTLKGLSGQQLTFSVESAGLVVFLTANVKADGYLITKILPELTIATARGPRVRKATTDTRIKDGETIVLALGNAGRLGQMWLFLTPRILPKPEE